MTIDGVDHGFNRQWVAAETDPGGKLADDGADLMSRRVVLDRAWARSRIRQREQAYV
ncbi:hypothetical protein PY650_32695 [Rhizobium calliandrae]|uniref:Uncharacterized protein n=1 Tax=Rhizobium calliandrae TaxID=1312182 RepID=A0ABT7KNR0_9HYPH|nr:hypothetical protein [Rhizobium calliandrae]MDL2410278.1 hypothetical protein [Rhizobium calliandrae]